MPLRKLAFQFVPGRPPTAKEHALARGVLAQSPLNEFCRALFNLNDFVYAECLAGDFGRLS